jgi:hypothetical protein
MIDKTVIIICSVFIMYVVMKDVSKIYLQSTIEGFEQKNYGHTLLSTAYKYNHLSSALLSGFIMLMIYYLPVNIFYVNCFEYS